MRWTTVVPLLASIGCAGLLAGVSGPGAATPMPSDADASDVPGQDAVELIFRSDFTTALGSTSAALLDSSQPVPWSSLLNNGNALRVVEGDPLGFPGNALEIRAVARDGAAGAYAANVRLAGMPVPAAGESRFYRWYIRVTVPNSYTADPLTHPIQDGLQGGRTNWMFEVVPAANGTWQAGFNVNGGGANPWPNNRWQLRVPLQKNVTYRFACSRQALVPVRCTRMARVYSGGTLLYDNDDFRNADGSRTLATPTPLRFTDVAQLANFQGGLNGLAAGSASQFPFIVYYQGGFEIRGDRWPGRS